MSFLISVKVFCDLSLYAAVVVAVAPWFTELSPLFPPALLCAAGVGFASLLSSRGSLRYLGLLPAAAGYLLCAGAADAAVMTPMVIYTLFLIRKGHFALAYGPYYDFFVSGLKFLGLAILFATIAMDWTAMLPYALIYLALGVFLLRQLRLGALSGWKDKFLNFLTLAGAVALGGGICLGLWLLSRLRFPASDLVEWILTYVLYGVSLLMGLGSSLSEWLAKVLPEGFGFGDHTETPDLSLPAYEFHVGEEVLPNDTVRSLVGLAFLVFAAVSVFLLIRRMVRMLRRGQKTAVRQVFTESLSPTGRKKREKFASNRAKVRTFYRKFLQYVRDRGITVHHSHTSADVLSHAAPVVDAQDADALRQIYLSARYDEEHEVTNEQVKDARRLYQKIRDT